MTTMPELHPGEVLCILQAADARQMTGVTIPHGVPAHEVRRGPYDGRLLATVPDRRGDLPAVMSIRGGEIVYELDGKDTDGRAVYRYAPLQSTIHDRIMVGVQQAYADAAAAKAAGR
jgi:hypothetical protein